MHQNIKNYWLTWTWNYQGCSIYNVFREGVPFTTVYTRVQVERVYKSNPIFEAKNTTFLEKVWFFSFHQLNKINRWSGIQG